MDNKTQIPLSRLKLSLMFLGSALFVFVGYQMLWNIFGILAIVFFGGILVLVGIKLFDPKCGLTIDSEGITDNSNFTSIGLITWADIRNIRSSRVRSEKFIFIEVNNPFYYINRSNNRLRKKIMRANLRMYGTPISLSSRTLKYSFSDLESLIMKEFEKQLLNKNESSNSDLLETNTQKTIDNS